jgi:hypothetical protein
MKIRHLSLALLLGIAATTAVQADTLLVDRVEREAAIAKPARGIHMDAVLAQFGEPSERVAPVGGDAPQHPPITRWIYPEFTVYFEHSLVIDAVANRSMALEQGPAPTDE